MVLKASLKRFLTVFGLMILPALPLQRGSAQDLTLARPPRPLGDARLISGPYPCEDQNCYQIEVVCPEVAQPRGVLLKVGDPMTGSPSRGTILFATGWIGSYLWEEHGPEAERVLQELRAAGFRTVQLVWQRNWFLGAPGGLEGQARLACRPATVAQWVYDHLHDKSANTAFCATGNSNGASQIGYMLAQYGLAEILSAVVLDGGPNWARIDLGCLHDDPADGALWLFEGDANTTDWGFGFPNNGSGPCGRMDLSFRERFQEASLAYGDWQYVYPKTMVWSIFGENDRTPARGHGLFFYQQLLEAGSPLVRMDIAPNTPHITSETREGANMIRDALLSECHPR